MVIALTGSGYLITVHHFQMKRTASYRCLKKKEEEAKAEVKAE